MTIAVITLAVALAIVVVSFLALGIWMIRRDGAKTEELTRAQVALSSSEMARAKSDEVIVQLRDQNDEDRRRFQLQLTENEQRFITFRNKVVEKAKGPELQAMLTDLVTGPPVPGRWVWRARQADPRTTDSHRDGQHGLLPQSKSTTEATRWRQVRVRQGGLPSFHGWMRYGGFAPGVDPVSERSAEVRD